MRFADPQRNSVRTGSRTTGVALTFVLIFTVLPAFAQDTPATIVLNGTVTQVEWSDGDSFRILDGEYDGHSVRLAGYNTLESYGPVHRWGQWTAHELYDIAHAASTFTAAGQWACSTDGETDHYDRVLVQCDGLIAAMAASGYGHVFAIGTPAAPAAISAQHAAQAARLGIWAKGVPDSIVTSLHSAAEGGDTTYNRVISTADGSSLEVSHEDTYETCQEVCIGDSGSESCLVYVPFNIRYGDGRADCLR